MAFSAPTRPGSARPAAARGSASPIWLITGLLALAVSFVLAGVGAALLGAPVSVLGLAVPLGTPQSFVVNLVGYVLTPMIVVVCYGIDRWQQRIGLRNNRNFVLRPGFTRALWWLMIVSLFVGLS